GGQDFDRRVPAAAVQDRVARQLARGGHDLRLVDETESVLDRALADRLAKYDDVVVPRQRKRLERHREGHPPTHTASNSLPFSMSRAVRTPESDMPSSTRVMATAGRIPTTTVSASRTRDIAAMFPSMRPMNESTISSAEISIKTPRAPVAAI